MFAAAVELRGVHVDHQRLARDALGGDAGVVGQPVVGVDDVELTLEVAGHLRRNHGVAGHLLHEVGAVLAREGVALLPGVGALPHLLAALDILLVVLVVLFGRDVGDHVRVDVDERHAAQDVVLAARRRAVEGLHVACVDDVQKALVLITVGVRHHEGDVHAVVRKTACHAVACCSETSGDMGRKLPSEH